MKKKLLSWVDSAIAGTGFGNVARHVLSALHNSGKFDIHHLAINFHGNFVDKDIVPWQQQPAKLMDPNDPHGMKMFLETVAKGDYDYIWICNDLYVTNEVSQPLQDILNKLNEFGRKVPVILYYYPVDCSVPDDGSSFLNVAHMPVCYTDYGRAQTLITRPEVEPRLRQMPHGVDTSTYRLLDPIARAHIKQSVFKRQDNPTVVINVNRNNTRKQIPYSMLAFKEFRKHVPNSVMYVHTAIQDQGGDLYKCIKSLGMDPHKDIIFPVRYSSKEPVPDEILNQLYNMGDIFLTTHLGEGWGLTITEAMAAGTPVVVPDNTCMRELVGEDSERGYIYPCKDDLWIDPSGFRKKGLVPDIVEKMLEVHRSGPKEQNPKVAAAREWTLSHNWKDIANKWIDLFLEADEIALNKRSEAVSAEAI